MTILGTRPEIIRLSRIIQILDRFSDHVLVHTGQNYDDRLSTIFFDELRVRRPDEFMGVQSASAGAQIGRILEGAEALFLKHSPDRVLILGDTNSGMAALIARRLGIPVYHMEAGNRCYDDRVPEEVNRRVIDHSSSILLPYTNRSRQNLLREGIAADRIYVTGNPINEVINAHSQEIGESQVLHRFDIEKGRYILVTMHRAENVDIEPRLRSLVDAMTRLHGEYGYHVICSFHPRTRAKVQAFGVDVDRAGLRFLEPFGFFDFVRLEKEAFCILSDSGTVQEEACLFGVPNVTIRDVTERPETLECGSNILAGADPAEILRAVKFVTNPAAGLWTPPPEYIVENVSAIVARVVLGYRLPDLAEQSWQNRRATDREVYSS